MYSHLFWDDIILNLHFSSCGAKKVYWPEPLVSLSIWSKKLSYYNWVFLQKQFLFTSWFLCQKCAIIGNFSTDSSVGCGQSWRRWQHKKNKTWCTSGLAVRRYLPRRKGSSLFPPSPSDPPTTRIFLLPIPV